MSGIDKLKEKVEGIKKESKDREEAEVKSANSALEKTRAMIQNDPALRALLQQDAKEEQEKSGGALPFLKVYVANKSTQVLADGKDPNNGWFFYTPTQEQYETVHCHILTISRGFRMPGMPDDKGEVKNKWNHIVSGIMLNDEPKPFWIFISGQARVGRLWEFQKELRKYNAAGIPSFPLILKLTTEKVKTEKSPAIVINFAIEVDETGNPTMVTDKEEYMALRDKVHDQEGYIEAYINRKEVVKVEEPKKVVSNSVEEKGETPEFF